MVVVVGTTASKPYWFNQKTNASRNQADYCYITFLGAFYLQRFAGLRGTVAAVSEPIAQMLRID